MRNDLKIGVILGIVVVAAVIFLVLISGDSSRIPSDQTDVGDEPEKILVAEPPDFVMPPEKPEPTVVVQPPTDTTELRDTLPLPAPEPCVALPVTVAVPPAELQPEPEPEEPKTMYHTVAKGDSLFKIAELFYGQGRHWKVIYNANKAAIKNPDVLPLGLKLRIPSPDEVADKY